MKAISAQFAGALGLTFALAACIPPSPEPSPAPERTPAVQDPVPQISLPAAGPDPAYANWMDAPRTPGDWSYNDFGFGTQAFYSDESSMRFVMQCLVEDPASRTKRIAIGRPGNFPETTQFRIKTETAERAFTARPFSFGPTSGAAVFLNANDPVFDAMALSKGRFAVETPGLPTLYLPAWAEVTRVIEDCR